MEEHSQWSGAPATSEETTSTSTGMNMADADDAAVDSFNGEAEAPQLAEDARFPIKDFLTLKGKASVKNIESDKDRANSGKENQALDLELSLLPPRKAVELFTVSQQTEEPQKNPFGVPLSANANAFRFPFTQSKKQPEHNQLTVFYKGTVNIYNVSPDLAKTIMLAANNKNIALCPGIPSTCHTGYIQPALTPKAGAEVSKIPIARRNSLKRFMEKRKDRVLISRAPYSTN